METKRYIAPTLLTEKEVWKILETVMDPEVPVLSVVDLGVVRKVEIDHTATPVQVTITITPTYSGCPAMDMIAAHIRMALLREGIKHHAIKTVLSPAWTTDWMSEKGKKKLQEFGIAPPIGKAIDAVYLENLEVECPHCHSHNTRLVSEFGSTACKAMYQCNNCSEPFDYFKCH